MGILLLKYVTENIRKENNWKKNLNSYLVNKAPHNMEEIFDYYLSHQSSAYF